MAVDSKPLAVLVPIAVDCSPLAVDEPMAVDLRPLAVVKLPMAVELSPPAVVSQPMAVEKNPLAVVRLPMAVEAGPLAVVPKPMAVENWPTLASSHSPPTARPARKAACPGYHIKRSPGPVAGIAPPVILLTMNPLWSAVPLTSSRVSVTGPAAKPLVVASRCTSVPCTLLGVPLAPTAGVAGAHAVPL